jgi:Zn-dependent M28 family amino/carboxypeptidase
MLRIPVVAALLASPCLAAKLEVDLVVETLVKSRLENGVVKRRQRQATIRELFADAGCVADDQPVDKDSGNVICTLPGETDSTIVVGGHFDFADRGQGIVDDWSGTALLPSLYQALKSRPRSHSYVFVAFAAEERGLVGSAFYVKSLTAAQRANIRAFVNLECLGLTPVKVWIHRSTPELTARLITVAKAINVPLQGANVEKVGDDDTHPFLSAGVPVISIHSLTQETFPMLHNERDQLSAIHFDYYYAAYKLVAYYLAFLDLKPE